MRLHHKTPKSLEILQALIRKAPRWEVDSCGHRVTQFVVKITPEIATQMIEHCNWRNRKTRQGRIQGYASKMRSDLWLPIGMLICTESGELLAGQHRLKAVVESGKTLEFFLLVVNHTISSVILEEEGEVIPWSKPDYLKSMGVADAYRVSPVIDLERNFRMTGDPFQNVKTSKQESLAQYKDIGKDRFDRAFAIVPRGILRQLGIDRLRSFIDWLALHLSEVDTSGSKLFFDLLSDASSLKDTDAPWVLREELLKLTRLQGKNASAVQMAHLIVHSWEYFFNGQPTSPQKIKHRPNDEFPHIAGESMVQPAAPKAARTITRQKKKAEKTEGGK